MLTIHEYTELTLEAERVALLNGETRGDVIAWLTSSNVGRIEHDWEEDND